MPTNLSPMDRDVRIAIVAPIALLGALAIGANAFGVLAFAIGVAAVTTAIVGYDPTYELFRGRTTTAH